MLSVPSLRLNQFGVRFYEALLSGADLQSLVGFEVLAFGSGNNQTTRGKAKSGKGKPSGRVNWEFLEKMFAQAEVRAPALAAAGVKTAWAGLYESTPDHQAILGPVPEVEGFWCAAGFSGHGFMQAPAAGMLLSQLLLDGHSEIDISPFAFTRFARGSLVKERNVI